MIVDPARAPVSGEGGMSTLHLSVAGGITQFGAYIDTLQPGAWSSERHWHESEDEFVHVLDGIVTLRDDDGMHDLGPGDAICWRHGDPNAHHLTNRSDKPCRYVIVGTRVARDISHYPDSGRRQVNGETTWQILNADGTALRGGTLPDELMNLPPVWGTPFDPATKAERLLRAETAAWTRDPNPTHPILGPGPGPCSYRLLSDPGGLTQFGAFIELLPPGSRSSFRHWHEAEDEMILMLEGEMVLIEDREQVLVAGDAACWPAGLAVAHQLENRSAADARYLVIGSRYRQDVIHYPDHDLIAHKDGTARRYTQSDGRAYDGGRLDKSDQSTDV
jgi:uncharacterized cupin superfamily protein